MRFVSSLGRSLLRGAVGEALAASSFGDTWWRKDDYEIIRLHAVPVWFIVIRYTFVVVIFVKFCFKYNVVYSQYHGVSYKPYCVKSKHQQRSVKYLNLGMGIQ